MKMELGGEKKRILSPVEPFCRFLLSEMFMNLSKATVIQGTYNKFQVERSQVMGWPQLIMS